jgi:hypothetical protein
MLRQLEHAQNRYMSLSKNTLLIFTPHLAATKTLRNAIYPFVLQLLTHCYSLLS